MLRFWYHSSRCPSLASLAVYRVAAVVHVRMKVRTCRPAVVVSHDITPICRYLRTVRVQRWASLGYSIFSTFFYLFPSDSPHGVLVFSSAIVHVIYMTLLLLLLYHVQANSSMRADARPRLRTCSWWPWEVYNVGKPQKSGWAAKRCTSERSFVKKGLTVSTTILLFVWRTILGGRCAMTSSSSKQQH